MSNHLIDILRRWYPERTHKRWALAAVWTTEGSVYRKAGAMMLISDAGDVLGMLSGGCLESDLQLQAQRVLATGSTRHIVYDAADQSSVAWQLGIGCGGVAHIVIHPCDLDNNYLGLADAFQLLTQRHHCRYLLRLTDARGSCAIAQVAQVAQVALKPKASAEAIEILLSPPPHLIVFGAGVDVLPIVRMGRELGWSISLVDKRASHYKPQRFAEDITFFNVGAAELNARTATDVDAVIIATHNVEQDAEALLWVQSTSARYCGVLGPPLRRERVLHAAGIQARDLRVPLAGPMGLALGGELPESIALSVLAECHAVLFGSTAAPMSKEYLS